MKEKSTPEENAEAMSILRATFPVGMAHAEGEAMPRTAHDQLPGESFPDKPEVPDYEQAKIDALAYIASLGITASILPNGVAETPAETKDGKPWLHFRWLCHALRENCPRGFGGADFDDYKTGIGNAEFKKLAQYGYGMEGYYSLMKIAEKGQIHILRDKDARLKACKFLKPTPPDIADILGSYARDYVDAHRAGSFEDFAAEMGYDTDSRKAEAIYQQCLAQRKPLIALGLSMAEIEKIADYASQF